MSALPVVPEQLVTCCTVIWQAPAYHLCGGLQYSVTTVHRALVPRAETTWLYEGVPCLIFLLPRSKLVGMSFHKHRQCTMLRCNYSHGLTGTDLLLQQPQSWQGTLQQHRYILLGGLEHDK